MYLREGVQRISFWLCIYQKIVAEHPTLVGAPKEYKLILLILVAKH